MPRPRDHFHAAVLDGVFYAIGGRDANINATNAFVDAFDFETQTWTTLPTELPTERGGFASAVLGDEILIIGGEGGGNTYDEVEAYNPVTNRWRTLTPTPTPRHGVQAASTSRRAAPNRASAPPPCTKRSFWVNLPPAPPTSRDR